MMPVPGHSLSCKSVATGDSVVTGVSSFIHVASINVGFILFKQMFCFALARILRN